MLYGFALGVHVTSMLAAMLSFAGGELLLALARQGRGSFAVAALLAGKGGSAMVVIGTLAGFVLLYAGGWPLLAPWLLASFALIAALMAVERRFVRPWQVRLGSALGSGASGAQIEALAREKSALIGRVTVLVLFAFIAALMTLKP